MLEPANVQQHEPITRYVTALISYRLFKLNTRAMHRKHIKVVEHFETKVFWAVVLAFDYRYADAAVLQSRKAFFQHAQ